MAARYEVTVNVLLRHTLNVKAHSYIQASAIARESAKIIVLRNFPQSECLAVEPSDITKLPDNDTQ